MSDDWMMDEEELDFEEMMQKRIQENFADENLPKPKTTEDRLKEMNKKLPSWSLEPPYTYMR